MTGERRRWPVDDVGVVAAGVVFAVLASMPWYVAFLGPGERVPFRAWDLGILAILAVLLSLYAAGRVVWLRYRPLRPEVPLAPGVEPLVSSLLALVLVLYRALVAPDIPLASRVGVTGWLIAGLVVVVLQTVCAARTVARTGFRA